MYLPDEITSSAQASHHTKSVWTAVCENDRRFRWPVASHRAMGLPNLRQWVQKIIATAGYPVRIQHWESGAGDSTLLAESVIWGSGDELEDEFGSAEEMPSFGAEVIGQDGQRFIEGAAPVSPFERAITMLIEKPETVRMVLASVGDFFESWRTPDELAMARIEEGAAEAAANAVENKLAELLRKSGYRIGDDGELHGPDDADPDRLDAADEDEEQDEDETLDVSEELEEDERPSDDEGQGVEVAAVPEQNETLLRFVKAEAAS